MVSMVSMVSMVRRFGDQDNAPSECRHRLPTGIARKQGSISIQLRPRLTRELTREPNLHTVDITPTLSAAIMNGRHYRVLALPPRERHY